MWDAQEDWESNIKSPAEIKYLHSAFTAGGAGVFLTILPCCWVIPDQNK